MRTKILIIILLMALGVYLGLNWSDIRNQSNEQNKTTVETNNTNLNTDYDHINKVKKTTESIAANDQTTTEEALVSNDEWFDQLMQQLSLARYSEDPFVEMMSVGLEFETCGNNRMGNKSFWRFQDQSPTPAQQEILNQMQSHCDSLVQQYSILDDKKMETAGLELLTNMMPTSKLGKYLHQLISKRQQPEDMAQFGRNLIAFGIKEDNAQMLKMSTWITGMSHNSEPIVPAHILKGQNQPYINAVTQMAITSLACEYQNGLTCAPTSSFMQTKCFDDEHFCGMDFSQWYELAVTPGIAADVQLLKQYFQSLKLP